MVTLQAKSQDREDEELSSEGNANANKEDGEIEATERRDKSTAVLLSEEELVDLLKKEAAEKEVEESELKEEEVESDKGAVESGEAVEASEDKEEEKLEDDLEVGGDDGKVKEETVEEEEVEEVGKMPHKGEKEESVDKMADRVEQSLEEADGSTDLDIPVDLDYASDSGVLQPLQMISAKMDDTKPPSKTDVPHVTEKESIEKELPIIDEDYDQDVQNTEAAHSEDASDVDKLRDDKEAKSKEMDKDVKPQEPKSSRELESGSSPAAGKEEERSKNDSAGQGKGKTRKQKKNQRARKHSPQREETQSGQEVSQQEPQEPGSTDNTVHKAKRRRAGEMGK